MKKNELRKLIIESIKEVLIELHEKLSNGKK